MYRVETFSGYKFESDIEVSVGDIVDIPIPEDNGVKTPTHPLRFFGQMFGLQKDWNNNSLHKYKAPDGLKHIPEIIKNADNAGLKMFLTQMYSAGGSLVKHTSSAGISSAEVRIKCIHKTMADELQQLWLRFEVKTRVRWSKQLDKWLVTTCGSGGYVNIRPFLVDSSNPRLLKRLKELDSYISFKFKVRDNVVRDRVVQVEHVSD